jgi:hypothetical protein
VKSGVPQACNVERHKPAILTEGGEKRIENTAHQQGCQNFGRFASYDLSSFVNTDPRAKIL